MLERMVRRGPDGSGSWDEGSISLGHTRLAILDLDGRSSQPMLSPDSRYVIVFNGEIYNFRALRRELETDGVVFRTSSDTEVILALFAREGEAMLPKLRGMFAFVIWDRRTQRAFLARDPYGIKPLYLAKADGGLILASQVKALLATGLVSRAPDLRGQAGFWLLGSVPEPHTWYQDIRAIPAGHCGWIEQGQLGRLVCWHDIGKAWREPDERILSDVEVRAQVCAALRESVERHLVSDVPVGVFLSGGIDSGALAGLMMETEVQDVHGVTITYDEFVNSREDEAPVAATIAEHYGIRHHVRYVRKAEFLADLPRILDAMDQPSIDGINTWFASKAVAELGLKVVISGVGGDELFQGYSSFNTLPRIIRHWNNLRRLPGIPGLARWAANLQTQRTNNARWRHAPGWLQTIEGAWWLRRSVNAPEDLPGLMGAEQAHEVLRDLDAVQWLRSMTGPLPDDPKLALGQIESMTYLRNQLLRDSDWASMDHSVELRAPLVDAHLLANVASLLPHFSRFPGKNLLANAPNLSLPDVIKGRRKTGFGIPVGRWIQESAAAGEKDHKTRALARMAASEYNNITPID